VLIVKICAKKSKSKTKAAEIRKTVYGIKESPSAKPDLPQRHRNTEINYIFLCLRASVAIFFSSEAASTC